jgi:hypothetical protein
MNTTENNKIIAEFMGYKIQKNPTERFFGKHSHPITKVWIKELSFNSDWNWLMEVVEKIENYNDGCTLFIIEDERSHIDTQNGFEIDSVGHTKKESVYNACVEFIKWYNLQNS